MCIWTRTYSCGFVEHLPKPHDHDPGLQDPRITICRCNTLVPMASSKAACVVCRSHSEAIRHHTPVGEVVDIRDGRGDGHGGVIVPGPLTAWAKEMGLEKEWLWDENLKATELAPLSSESVDTRSFHTANEFSSSKTDDDKKRTDSTPKKGDRDKKNKNEAYTPPGDWMQKLLGRGGGRS